MDPSSLVPTTIVEQVPLGTHRQAPGSQAFAVHAQQLGSPSKEA